MSFKVDGWIRRLVCSAAPLAIALGACTRLPPEIEPKPGPTGHTSPAAEMKAERDLATATRLPPPPLLSVPPEVVTHGPRNEKRIALTFDACSTRDVSQYDELVTRTLIATHTPATIFLGGRWAVEEAAHVKELAANPLFELGNHSYTHPHMAAIVDGVRIRRELQRTQAEIHRLTGKTPKFFRPPYGEYNERLVRIAAELGLTTVEYDLASGDPDVHATKERLDYQIATPSIARRAHHAAIDREAIFSDHSPVTIDYTVEPALFGRGDTLSAEGRPTSADPIEATRQ